MIHPPGGLGSSKDQSPAIRIPELKGRIPPLIINRLLLSSLGNILTKDEKASVPKPTFEYVIETPEEFKDIEVLSAQKKMKLILDMYKKECEENPSPRTLTAYASSLATQIGESNKVLDVAINILKTYLTKHSSSSVAHCLSQILVVKADLDKTPELFHEALGWVEMALKLDINNVSAWRELATILNLTGKSEEEEQRLTKAVHENPDDDYSKVRLYFVKLYIAELNELPYHYLNDIIRKAESPLKYIAMFGVAENLSMHNRIDLAEEGYRQIISYADLFENPAEEKSNNSLITHCLKALIKQRLAKTPAQAVSDADNSKFFIDVNLKLMVRHPHDPTYPSRLAFHFISCRRLEEAAECANKAKDICPYLFDARHISAIIAFRQGKFAEAIEINKGALRHIQDPKDFFSCYELFGLCFYNLREYTKAAWAFQQAQKHNDDTCCVEYPVSMYKSNRSANALKKAIEILQNIYKKYPDNLFLIRLLCKYYLLSNDEKVEGLLSVYSKVVKTSDPDKYDLKYHTKKGHLYSAEHLLRHGKYLKALQQVNCALEITPADKNGLMLKARIVKALNNIDDFDNIINALLVHLDDPKVKLFVIEYYLDDSRLDEAEYYLLGFNHKGFESELLTLKGYLEKLRANNQTSLKYSMEAISKNTTLKGLAFCNIGKVYLETERHQLAVATFTKALATEPHNQSVLLLRAESYLALHQIDQAYEDLKKCNASQKFYALKAQCFNARNNLAEASKYCLLYLDSDVKLWDWVIVKMALDLFVKQRKFDHAIGKLNTFLQLYPEHVEALRKFMELSVIAKPQDAVALEKIVEKRRSLARNFAPIAQVMTVKIQVPSKELWIEVVSTLKQSYVKYLENTMDSNELGIIFKTYRLELDKLLNYLFRATCAIDEEVEKFITLYFSMALSSLDFLKILKEMPETKLIETLKKIN